MREKRIKEEEYEREAIAFCVSRYFFLPNSVGELMIL